MKNKGVLKGRVRIARAGGIIIIFLTIILMVTTSPTDADTIEVDRNIQLSNFYMRVIGDTIGVFKVSENADDKSPFGSIVISPLKIIKKEIAFFNGVDYHKGNDDEEAVKAQEEAKSLIINPFRLNDESVNKRDSDVEIIGDPLDNSKKKILIYHTHTNEAYAEGNQGLSTTVAAVGDALTSELEAMGFTVIHDKTVHDKPDYNNAYSAARSTMEGYMNNYGDFDLIIDLHRDGGPAKESVTTSIDGETMAKVMFVTTEQDPRAGAHMANLNSIIETAESMYPGIIRPRKIFTYLSGINFYNQDLSDNAILMEVGADVNELSEAQLSMKYMGKVFATYLNNK